MPLLVALCETYDLEPFVSLCSFDWTMALRFIDTHNITLENLTLLGPNSEYPTVPIKLRDYEITMVMANVTEFRSD